MIDKSAIEFISQQAVHAAAPFTLETDVPAVVIGGEIRSLEKFGNKPARHRANYSTSSLPHYFAYCDDAAKEVGSSGSVFVNADDMSAVAIFDIGDASNPSYCENTAKLALKQTAEMTALRGVHEKRLSQKAAIDWIIDWANNITFLDAEGSYLQNTRAINALRSITIKTEGEAHSEVRDTGRTLSALEQAEATSKETLPAGLNFNLAPFLGLEIRTINVRITINTEEAKPSVTLRIVGYEKLVQELGEELVTKIGAELEAKGFSVFAGTYTPGK